MPANTNPINPDYVTRLNRVFDYIDANLDGDLSLDRIAQVAYFSPYHFHRIFKFITGETLNEYVVRRRLTKAADVLLHSEQPISELAQKFGFSEVSSFSRAFKKHFDASPTEFKKQNPNRFSKISQLLSKNGQPYPTITEYLSIIENHKNWIKMNAQIEVKEMPKMETAYVSCKGLQNLDTAYGKLMQWATPNGLMNDQTKMATVFHDSFKFTAPSEVRMSASILLNESKSPEGEVSLRALEPGKCIVGSFEIGLDEFEKSWTGLFVWMNQQGYTKAEHEPFEIYHNDFNEHPQQKCIVDLCIPVV